MKSLLLSFTLIFFSACDTRNTAAPEKEALLLDLTGLDGCSWVFQLESGDRLEPSNLHEFDVELADSARYSISYEVANMASFCMVGDIIDLKSVRKLPE